MPRKPAAPRSPRAGTTSGGRNRDRDTLKGKVRPHDSFELIRWLAYSQPDPRKALAELVQNSLDAQAAHVRVTRVRLKSVPCLRIHDDGDGVIPELPRPEALKYIATHIGHSRKRHLSPQERLELMTQGQYGIGLLGFWSLGAQLDIRSAVPGQRPYRLLLHRDSSRYEIEPLRGHLGLDERSTEVVVSGLRREALAVLAAGRAADYLAAELRGQLLAREVELVIEDKIARGRAQKLIRVRPPRFLGERVDSLTAVAVPGHPPIRLEIYVAPERGDGGEPHALAVYCTGTLVADDFHALAALGLDHSPWTDTRLVGMVDWPAFKVAPGSRRGVLADDAAGAFSRALLTAEPALQAVLETLERRREEEADRHLVRDLQRAFRGLYRQRPRYAMLPVESPGDRGAAAAGDGAAGGAEGTAAGTDAPAGPDITSPETAAAAEDVATGDVDAAAAAGPDALESVEAADSAQGQLLPPGPLHSVRIAPARLRVERGGTRRARAEALDASGRAIEEPIAHEWRLVCAANGRGGADEADEIEPLGRLEPVEGRPDVVLLHAGDIARDGELQVVVRSGGLEAFAAIPVEVVDELHAGRSDEGIPKPQFIYDPGASWRSRMVDARWQVNSGHHEFRGIADRPALKLRYLALLFAKEVVLRSYQDPRLEKPLEQLVEVMAFADRNLAGKGARSAKGAGADKGARGLRNPRRVAPSAEAGATEPAAELAAHPAAEPAADPDTEPARDREERHADDAAG
jgi:hypothetical protein